ncbi:MAG: hypothetical protein ACR2M1_13705, partial [Gemmatimonadaceae bacterium]
MESYTEVVDLMLSRQYRDLTQFQQARANQLYAEITRHLQTSYAEVTRFVTQQMQDYAVVEAEIATAQLSAIVEVPGLAVRGELGGLLSHQLVQSIAELPIQGLKISDWFEGQAQTMARETKRTIQQGMIAGKGPASIARDVVSGERSSTPAVSKRAMRDARAIMRTTVNAVQNHAAAASYEAAGPTVSDRYKWLSVRDKRTSAI